MKFRLQCKTNATSRTALCDYRHLRLTHTQAFKSRLSIYQVFCAHILFGQSGYSIIKSITHKFVDLRHNENLPRRASLRLLFTKETMTSPIFPPEIISPWVKWGFYEPDDYVLKDSSTKSNTTKHDRKSKSEIVFSDLVFRSKDTTQASDVKISSASHGPGLVIRKKPRAQLPPGELCPIPEAVAVETDNSSETPQWRPRVRVMLDEICVTPTLELDEREWSLHDIILDIPFGYAPQAYGVFEAGILDTYVLVQETSTQGTYDSKQFIKFSKDEVREFSNHIKRNITRSGMALKIEMHFGSDDDAASLKKVWAEKDLDCWPGEEASLHSDNKHIWVPREGEWEPELRKMTDTEIEMLRDKQDVLQPSTIEWFRRDKLAKQNGHSQHAYELSLQQSEDHLWHTLAPQVERDHRTLNALMSARPLGKDD